MSAIVIPRRKIIIRRRRVFGQPTQTGYLFLRSLRRLHLDGKVVENMVAQQFMILSGGEFQRRARVERVEVGISRDCTSIGLKGPLRLRVEHNGWATEFQFTQHLINERLNRSVGIVAQRLGLHLSRWMVDRKTKLLFTIGPIQELPVWTDGEPDKPAPTRIPLPLDPRFAGALTQIKDDDLRDALGSLYVASCKFGVAQKPPGK